MIDILVDEDIEEEPLPSRPMIEQAVHAALAVAGMDCPQPDLCIRFASDAEVRKLNDQWRGRDKVTDVLSFPLQDGPEFSADEPLGDVILAMPFVRAEARRLGLKAGDHALHLIIHACLHLIGHDHIDDADAAAMQALENAAMRRLGLHCPYPPVNEEIE